MKRNVLILAALGIMLLPGLVLAQRVERSASGEDLTLEIKTIKSDIKEAIVKNDKKRVDRLLGGNTVRFLSEADFDELIGEAQKLLKVKESISHSFWNWTLMLGGAAVIGWIGWPMFQRRTRVVEDQLNEKILSELHIVRQSQLASAQERTRQIGAAWQATKEKKHVTAPAVPAGMDEGEAKKASEDAQESFDVIMEQLATMLGQSEEQAKALCAMVERNAEANFKNVDDIITDGVKKRNYLIDQRWGWGDWGLSTALVAFGGFAVFRGFWAPYAQRNRAREIVQALKDTKAMVKPVR